MISGKNNWMIIIVIVIAVNLILNNIDKFLFPPQPGQGANIEKMEEALNIIGSYYVDSVNFEYTVEGALEGALETLDPHSVYITREDVKRNEENFNGHYFGIGIHFDILDHYITVLNVINGSPAEESGLLPGDKIIKIDGRSARDITTNEVPKKLKGPKGSKVIVTIIRNQDIEFDAEIIRDEIPITTINTWFMLDEKSGYIWLNRFAHTTSDELETALIELERQGMSQLILDLRGNGGGLLQQAVEIVGKFISGHHLVVYTKGRMENSDNEYYTDDFGQSIDRKYPLIVLIDEGSASASEIVAGAIQDYDRGLIIGENSFGKGLVQNEFPLPDGTILRLTISKYYTPSGRLIQKPYKGKEKEEYYNNFHKDSLNSEPDSLETQPLFYTTGGRKVYGGGGIHPDSIIAYKSFSKIPELSSQLIAKRIFFETAVELAPKYERYKDNFNSFSKNFSISSSDLQILKRKASLRNIVYSGQDYLQDRKYHKLRLKAEIAKIFWGYRYFNQIILQEDIQLEKSAKLFGLARELSRKKFLKIN